MYVTYLIGIDNFKRGSGGAIPTYSTTVIPFTSADRRRKNSSVQIPNHCCNGHALTPDNVRIDHRERRWRCVCVARSKARRKEQADLLADETVRAGDAVLETDKVPVPVRFHLDTKGRVVSFAMRH